jgi:hypothetical protein
MLASASSAPDPGYDEETSNVELLAHGDPGSICAGDSVKPSPRSRNARRPSRAAEPEKRLMAAVLQTALDDHLGSVSRRAAGYVFPPDRRQHHAAAAYVASGDRRWPFSFENLCEALNVDPARLRYELGKPVSARTPVAGRSRIEVHDIG